MRKSPKNSRLYLEDILTAIAKIIEYTGEGKDAFIADEKTQDAVLYQIAIIGEASAKLPATLKAEYPEIPWRKTIGMRNIVIHDYSETDLSTVWIVVERDIPILQKTAQRMLEEIISE